MAVVFEVVAFPAVVEHSVAEFDVAVSAAVAIGSAAVSMFVAIAVIVMANSRLPNQAQQRKPVPLP